MWLIVPVAFGPILLRAKLLHDIHLNLLGVSIAWTLLMSAIGAVRPIDDSFEADKG